MMPQAKRRAATGQRLRDALDRFVRRASEPSETGAGSKLTVAALAREAGVGRNAIYANHREIIAELRRVIDQRAPQVPSAKPPAQGTDWRAAAAELHVQNRRLATENAALLKRALDAERIANQAEKKAARLTAELRKMRQPEPLHSRSKPPGAADK